MQFKLLAVGVAVAACFTSVATPAYSAGDERYQSGAGDSLVVDSQGANLDRVLGGSTTSTDYKTGSVTVNAGNWDMVVGGSYALGDT